MHLLIKSLFVFGIFTLGGYGTYKTIGVYELNKDGTNSENSETGAKTSNDVQTNEESADRVTINLEVKASDQKQLEEQSESSGGTLGSPVQNQSDISSSTTMSTREPDATPNHTKGDAGEENPKQQDSVQKVIDSSSPQTTNLDTSQKPESGNISTGSENNAETRSGSTISTVDPKSPSQSEPVNTENTANPVVTETKEVSSDDGNPVSEDIPSERKTEEIAQDSSLSTNS